MFKATIVIWLVLLVLALTVVTFVSRLVEKYRLDRARPYQAPANTDQGKSLPI